jgi:hypothetical protein
MQQREHPGVYCMLCYDAVRGSRWRCLLCFDLDMCSGCYARHKAGSAHPGVEFSEPVHKSWKKSMPLISFPAMIRPGFGGSNPLQTDISASGAAFPIALWMGGLAGVNPGADAHQQLARLQQMSRQLMWDDLVRLEQRLHGSLFRTICIKPARPGASGGVGGGGSDRQFYRVKHGSAILVAQNGLPVAAVSLVVPQDCTSVVALQPAASPAQAFARARVYHSSHAGSPTVVVTNLLPPDIPQPIKVVVTALDGSGNPVSSSAPAHLPAGLHQAFPSENPVFAVSVSAPVPRPAFVGFHWVTTDILARAVPGMVKGAAAGGARLGGGGLGAGMAVGPALPPGWTGDAPTLVVEVEATGALRGLKLAPVADAVSRRITALEQAMAATGPAQLQAFFTPSPAPEAACKCCGGPEPDAVLFPCGHQCVHLDEIVPAAEGGKFIAACPTCGGMVHAWMGRQYAAAAAAGAPRAIAQHFAADDASRPPSTWSPANATAFKESPANIRFLGLPADTPAVAEVDL